jgi:hypothetical protein
VLKSSCNKSDYSWLGKESSRVSLFWEGEPDLPSGCSSLGRAPDTCDIVGNLQLLPEFNEKDPEMFKSKFCQVRRIQPV